MGHISKVSTLASFVVAALRTLRAAPPAFLALLVLAASFSLSILPFKFLISYPWPYWAAVCAIVALTLVMGLRMAWWWRFWLPIFPFAIGIALMAQVPTYYYLAGFVCLSLLYWSSFRTQVPYYPSTKALLPALETLLPAGRGVRFIDIGSGFGGVVFALAARRCDGEFHGIEIAPLPWLVSWFRNGFAAANAKIFRGDYRNLCFDQYDVVFAYLSPAAMPELWEKARSEMRTGTLLLSFEFSIPEFEPVECIKIAPNSPNLYVWRI